MPPILRNTDQNYKPSVEIIAHQVDEIQSLRHGCDVVGLVDGVKPGRDCCSDHEVVLVEFCSHFS